ncbi:hypothetical protein CSV79_09630 [Sporosarcina sp. P13]|uniref:hypothetical protein n=1 Tax=Sporosarcina sp. P13 TaxID=2048263 RepID=UPI000C162DCA|nr:hypothetical protein [Sporosarcina sp. P13]PIC63811.1 hypothetical protein CSV79_09630 [Sporosarcina sp. P13]
MTAQLPIHNIEETLGTIIKNITRIENWIKDLLFIAKVNAQQLTGGEDIRLAIQLWVCAHKHLLMILLENLNEKNCK